ncbi:MAG TPA: hypothetical protein VHT21_17195 [Stellaceae bacterium]|nr:hypothetical protein [Stellaceae bacterium]
MSRYYGVTAIKQTPSDAARPYDRRQQPRSVMGIKVLLLKQKTQSLEQRWAEEHHYTTQVVRGAKAEEAFPEFIARRGRPLIERRAG